MKDLEVELVEIKIEVFRKLFGKVHIQDGVVGRLSRSGVFISHKKIDRMVNNFMEVEKSSFIKIVDENS